MRVCERGRGACACACAGAAVLLLLAAVTADDEKRMEMSPMPFMMGSRYGRSSEPRLIVPRNDRFFMSSRYGKRSWPAGGKGAGGGEGGRGAAGRTPALVCQFTGVPRLYRCTAHTYDKRSAEDSGSQEGE